MKVVSVNVGREESLPNTALPRTSGINKRPVAEATVSALGLVGDAIVLGAKQ